MKLNRWIALVAVLTTLMWLPNVPAQLHTPPPVAAQTQSPEAAATSDEQTSLLEEVEFTSLWTQNSLARWLILFAAILAGLVLGKLVQTLLRRIGRILDGRGAHARAHLFNDLASPASLIIFTIGLAIGLLQLRMSDQLEILARKFVQTLIAASIFWYVYNLIAMLDVPFRRMIHKRTDSALDDMLVPLIRKALRIFLLIIAALFILDTVFEADIGAWLAGLGIAGLAASLASQDSLKNLFGSMTIFMDRPYLVGSHIKYGEHEGIVEEMGFRSTRLRTFDGHLITIPNSAIVNEPVTNVSARPHIRRKINVTITYDTPPDKVRQAVDIIKQICETDGVREAIHDPNDATKFPPRIYFNDFNADSLNIVIYYWFRPAVWWDCLAHADKFNQLLLERFNEAGIDFAFPTQTLHLAGDQKRRLNVDINHAE